MTEVAEVGGPVLAEDEDVVEVDEDEGHSIKTLSIILWNVWAAFRRPNGIFKNSKRPKGVTIAVLRMSVAAIGT